MILAGCSKTEVATLPSDFMEVRKKQPISESRKIEYLYSENGVVRARLTAPHTIEYEDPRLNDKVNYLDRKPVILEFYEADGSIDSRLVADRAKVYTKNGYAEAMGNVVVTNSKGEKLETELLRWNRQLNNINTNRQVKITRKDEIIIGDSLEANTNFSIYKLFKIRGQFKVNTE